MAELEEPTLETDPRFPSGPWIGFFVQKHLRPGRHAMELHLTFRNQVVTGEGRDLIGSFHLKGQYSIADGKCYWTKGYDGKHDVFYQGYNEGKGIWGTWEIASDGLRGGFHVWPVGMGDPTQPELTEEEDLPAPVFEADLIETGRELVIPIR